MGAHDSRQHDDDGQVWLPPLRRRGFGAELRSGGFLRPELGSCKSPGKALKSSRRSTASDKQPIAQRRARAVILKIVKMRRRRSLIEQRAPASLARNAGIHRIGIDDQIVVDAAEKSIVGEQHAQPFEQTAAFDVAGDNGQLRGLLRLGNG